MSASKNKKIETFICDHYIFSFLFMCLLGCKLTSVSLNVHKTSCMCFIFVYLTMSVLSQRVSIYVDWIFKVDGFIRDTQCVCFSEDVNAEFIQKCAPVTSFMQKKKKKLKSKNNLYGTIQPSFTENLTITRHSCRCIVPFLSLTLFSPFESFSVPSCRSSQVNSILFI